MGIYHSPERRAKCFRASITRHGIHYEKWFLTHLEAQFAFDAWDKQLLELYGPRSNKKLEVLNARRQAKALRALENRKKRKTIPTPCGEMIRKPTRRLNNHRCKPKDDCIHYDACLSEAANRNWAGWVSR
jgi:hypothetical protein